MIAPPEKLLPAIDRLFRLPPEKLRTRDGFVAALKLLKACRARIDADAHWPAHQEELTRKATDTAHAIVHRLSMGEIERDAAYASLGAIVDTTSGLIDPAALTLINDAYRSLKL